MMVQIAMKKATIFISTLMYANLRNHIEATMSIIVVPRCEKVYTAIQDHVDIQMIKINDQLFMDADTYAMLSLQVDAFYPVLIHSIQSNLSKQYPNTVCFNAKFHGNRLIHNLKYTDPQILSYIIDNNHSLIHTNQGYTGCALLLIQFNAGITSDKGLYMELVQEGFDMLLICEGHIHLDGKNDGFIGGASFVYDGTVYFNGDIYLHPDGAVIQQFIEAQGMKIFCVKGKPLFDMGSALCVEEVVYEHTHFHTPLWLS